MNGEAAEPSTAERLNANAFSDCRTYDLTRDREKFAGWAQRLSDRDRESMGPSTLLRPGYPLILSLLPECAVPFPRNGRVGAYSRNDPVLRLAPPSERGHRQRLHFSPGCRKWLKVRALALQNTTRNGSEDYFHAFASRIIIAVAESS